MEWCIERVDASETKHRDLVCRVCVCFRERVSESGARVRVRERE